jgi:hypothetical protein
MNLPNIKAYLYFTNTEILQEVVCQWSRFFVT